MNLFLNVLPIKFIISKSFIHSSYVNASLNKIFLHQTFALDGVR